MPVELWKPVEKDVTRKIHFDRLFGKPETPEASAEESIGWQIDFEKVCGKLPHDLMFSANL